MEEINVVCTYHGAQLCHKERHMEASVGEFTHLKIIMLCEIDQTHELKHCVGLAGVLFRLSMLGNAWFSKSDQNAAISSGEQHR